MKLEIGKTYLTRGGHEVTIFDENGGSTYPYQGYGNEGRLDWTADGSYLSNRGESPFDIISGPILEGEEKLEEENKQLRQKIDQLLAACRRMVDECYELAKT